jgi:hypothetical protein
VGSAMSGYVVSFTASKSTCSICGALTSSSDVLCIPSPVVTAVGDI